MNGAGIMLMSGDTPRGSICTTGTVSALIEDLQYELGEGPCVDAYTQDQPVLEPDLAEPATTRWPAFADPAVNAGAPAGEIAKQLAIGANFKYVVHQASGMVAAQLGTPVTHALLQLRAHAFGNDRNLIDVATDVVTRNLRFRPETNNLGLDTLS